jgi:hypothetical protein
MSHWYFATGGLLLSSQARDDYFRLARALTKASCSDTLLAPAWDQYAKSIDDKIMRGYRRVLKLSPDEATKGSWDNKMENTWYDEITNRWQFGGEWPDGKKELNKLPEEKEVVDNACAFKDYIFLQTLSSRLRTALTEDIASRRQPEPQLLGS